MSTTEAPDSGSVVERPFRVAMMHHPSHHVLDLDQAAEFFERVFGCSSTSIGVVLSRLTVRPDWPRNYSAYTSIRDVFFDSIDPERVVIDGVQQYESIEKPHLQDFGFSVEEQAEAYRALRRHGFRARNTLGVIGEGDDPPPGPNDPAPFFSLPEETGLRYQFYPAGPFPADDRTEPGWVLPPVSDDDPLGIDFCSHHTVLTSAPERPIELMVDTLGGKVIHEGPDALHATTGTYVYLGGSVIEYALPESGSVAYEDWASNDFRDTYHAITWKVAALNRTERHLRACGIEIAMRSDETIVTVPETSLGIPWGFSTRLIQGDPRGS
jgi:catechol 2,3-dioxygenase-like lactoylglutathione lyase family enzyme